MTTFLLAPHIKNIFEDKHLIKFCKCCLILLGLGVVIKSLWSLFKQESKRKWVKFLEKVCDWGSSLAQRPSKIYNIIITWKWVFLIAIKLKNSQIILFSLEKIILTNYSTNYFICYTSTDLYQQNNCENNCILFILITIILDTQNIIICVQVYRYIC